MKNADWLWEKSSELSLQGYARLFIKKAEEFKEEYESKYYY